MKKVIIEVSYLAELISDSNKLNALERGGVDNWDWYGESIGNYDDEHLEGIDSLEVTDEDVLSQFEDVL